jgi:hypothetical protein
MSTEDKGVATAPPNNRYNLMGVIYHALQGGQRYGKYVEDAECGGNREAARFFRDVREEDRRRAERGQDILFKRPSTTEEGSVEDPGRSFDLREARGTGQAVLTAIDREDRWRDLLVGSEIQAPTSTTLPRKGPNGSPLFAGVTTCG